jgi:transposase
MKIPNRDYTPEFRELAFKRVRDGKSISAVAKELDLVNQPLKSRLQKRASPQESVLVARKSLPQGI